MQRTVRTKERDASWAGENRAAGARDEPIVGAVHWNGLSRPEDQVETGNTIGASWQHLRPTRGKSRVHWQIAGVQVSRRPRRSLRVTGAHAAQSNGPRRAGVAWSVTRAVLLRPGEVNTARATLAGKLKLPHGDPAIRILVPSQAHGGPSVEAPDEPAVTWGRRNLTPSRQHRDTLTRAMPLVRIGVTVAAPSRRDRPNPAWSPPCQRLSVRLGATSVAD